MNALRKSLTKLAVLWALVIVFVGLTVTTENFFSIMNLRNILDQQAFILMIAGFATIVIISGGFDVSLGAIYILSPIVALKVENATGSILYMILAGSAVGIAAGLMNGVIIAYGKINSFITTLATSFILFGLAYILSDGSILTLSNIEARSFVTNRILGITSATWMAFIILIVSWILLERTRYGRSIFAIGGNIEAARLSGIRVARIQIIAFILGGFGAGLAGALNSIRTTSAQASDDFSVIFAVIAAIVVGGTSIAGGSGAIWRSVAGVFFIAILVNGFNLNGIDPVFQRIIQGLVILLAVGADSIRSSRRT
ncbi:MAG: ABC transporter permease [Actinobacteria bacterium]|nr:ABC transporter permease [Actinomycetota bacterium]